MKNVFTEPSQTFALVVISKQIENRKHDGLIASGIRMG